jgi:hypothetical protein
LTGQAKRRYAAIATPAPEGETIQATTAYLRRAIRSIRYLFHLLDVSAYSDETIVAAFMDVCPVVNQSWPSDEELRSVLQRLQQTTPARKSGADSVSRSDLARMRPVLRTNRRLQSRGYMTRHQPTAARLCSKVLFTAEAATLRTRMQGTAPSCSEVVVIDHVDLQLGCVIGCVAIARRADGLQHRCAAGG